MIRLLDMNPNGVRFETDEVIGRPRPVQQKGSRLVEWVQAHSGGLIKSESQANIVIIVFIIICIIFLFVFNQTSGSEPVRGPIPVGDSRTVPG